MMRVWWNWWLDLPNWVWFGLVGLILILFVAGLFLFRERG